MLNKAISFIWGSSGCSFCLWDNIAPHRHLDSLQGLWSMNYGIPHIVSQSKDWNVSSLLSSLSVRHSLPFDVKEKYSTFQNHKDWDSF